MSRPPSRTQSSVADEAIATRPTDDFTSLILFHSFSLTNVFFFAFNSSRTERALGKLHFSFILVAQLTHVVAFLFPLSHQLLTRRTAVNP